VLNFKLKLLPVAASTALRGTGIGDDRHDVMIRSSSAPGPASS
jgi:hypothetical protein